jgi:hypothetical protein
MVSRAQSDFGLLTLPDDGLDTFDDHPALLRSNKSPRAEKLADVASACHEKYVPVNFIDDEIYALIERWESCAKEAPSDVTMPVDIKLQDPIYEPMRQLPTAAAPRRFYRTFWRSVSRRLVEVSGHD